MIINPFIFAAAPSGPSDPLWGSVVTLLHLDSAAGSVLTDQKGNTCLLGGGATIDAAQKKFGAGSLSLDGTNDYVVIDDPGSAFDLGSSAFTFDWWFYNSNVSITSSKPMWSWRHTDGNNNTQLAANLRGGAIRVSISFDGSSDATLAAFGTGSMSLVNDTWHFCRLTRAASEFKLFIDGTQRGTTYTNATAFSALSRQCWLGKNNLTYFPGHIDDFRVTIGGGPRDGSEVPTAAFPDS